MTEFEHGMLLVCFASTMGAVIGTAIGLLINLISDLISTRRAKEYRLKEPSNK